MDEKELKRELRKSIKEKITHLPEGYLAAAGIAIAVRIGETKEYREAARILAFVSMKSEPDMYPLLRKILADGKELYLPACISDRDMEARLVKDLSELTPKPPYGIAEPGEQCPTENKTSMDLILVPCVSADRKGGRLGHGAGYYDRYLAGVQHKAMLLCPEALLSEDIPMEPHDLILPCLITENHSYRFV